MKNRVVCRIRNYTSCNPYEIAASEGITVLHSKLGPNIYGFSHTYKRQQMIVINNALPTKLARFVCAHELGFHVLYPSNNLAPHILYARRSVDKDAAQIAIDILFKNKIFAYLPRHTVLSPAYL